MAQSSLLLSRECKNKKINFFRKEHKRSVGFPNIDGYLYDNFKHGNLPRRIIQDNYERKVRKERRY